MRLIDADALIPSEVHTIVRKAVGKEVWESVLYAEQIDNAPSVDAVPVVRCGDCAYLDKSRECWGEGSKLYYCYMLDICTDENFYCASGERKLKQ